MNMIKRRRFISLSATGLAVAGIAPAFISNYGCTPDTSVQDIEPIKAPFDMSQLQRPVFPNRVFNILKFGALGDGVAKNTQAFRDAIKACSERGGGKVVVPEGKWFTGAIHLKSNVNLHMEEGAEIHFSDRPEDYLPVVFTRWAGFELMNYSPFIYAINCENIAITGPGKLFGHGEAWWDWFKRQSVTGIKINNEMVLKNVPPEQRVFGTPHAGLRPQFISPVNCRNILLEDFSIAQPGAFWTIQFIYCENIIARRLNLSVRGGPNNDGINMDSSRNALVEYCTINSQDDSIAIKSGINEDGRRVGQPTENIVLRHLNCNPSNGGLAIGSEMSGDVRNVLFQDCSVSDSRHGARMKSNSSRGGIAENIYFRNLDLKNIRFGAIEIETDYSAWMSDANGTAHPVFRNIEISNLTCDGARAAAIVSGKQEMPIQNLRLENVSIKAGRGMSFNWVNGLTLKNVSVEPAEGEKIIISNCQ